MCFLYYIGYAFNFDSYVAVGAEVDNEKMELLLSQLSGKDITELIAAGREKFASVPCGGGGVAVAAAAPASGGGAPAAEAKKEEKVEEKEESDDVRSLCLPLIPFCFATFLFRVTKEIPFFLKDILLSSTLFLYYRNEGCTTFIALMPSQPNAIVNCLFQFFCIVLVPLHDDQNSVHNCDECAFCRTWASASSTELCGHQSCLLGGNIVLVFVLCWWKNLYVVIQPYIAMLAGVYW
jgi:ribosomal protein L12E/L44/L45/RPP1/RPP2